MTAYIHDSRCHGVRGMKSQPARSAAQQHPYAIPCGVCMRGGFAHGPVVVVEVQTAPHAYAPSMIWPANAPRALCSVCREDHNPTSTTK